jgi:hypothetical protein
MLKASPFDSAALRDVAQGQLINARPIGSALLNPLVCSWIPPVAFARIDTPVIPIAAVPRADTLVRLARCGERVATGSSACTHYPVFKEPTRPSHRVKTEAPDSISAITPDISHDAHDVAHEAAPPVGDGAIRGTF